jgi:hypothetical protein
VRLKAGEAWDDNDLVSCQDDGRPWNPDHVSKRFKKLAALAGLPVICLHEGGRPTGNSHMRDAGVDQELRMREVGHARSVNDRYTHPLEQAHLGASEQSAALVRKAENIMTGTDVPILFPSEAVAGKSHSAGKGSAAAQPWWGGWGSNPRPADYEKHARLQHTLDLHQRLVSMPRMHAWH